MNTESEPIDYSPASADERWIDAALREHARLGRDGQDEELILRILRETVHRPAPSPRPAPVLRDRRLLFAVGAAAAAVVVLTLIVLPRPGTAPGTRHSDELRFVVRIAAPSSSPASAPASPTASPRPAAAPSRGELAIVAPETPARHSPGGSVPGDLELITEFGPTFTSLPRQTVRKESLRITADRGETTPGEVTYRGNVIVEHEQFRIEADAVRVPAPGEGAVDPAAPLQASGVRVVQPHIPCTAEARSLRFDPRDGTLVLTGVTRVETEKGELARFAPGDRLVLSGTGFSVETAPVERYADPVPRTR